MIQDLQWRYATKKMNGEQIPTDKLDKILEATRLSASSYGLQPFTIIVVSDKELKLRLKAAAYNQEQVGTASEVLVFCIPTSITLADVDQYIALTVSERGLTVEDLAGLKQMIVSTILELTAEQQQEWSAKQAYISLGTAMATAAQERIDACPMEGFDAAQFGEILELEKHGLKAVVILPLGYRSPDDASAQDKKVRKATDVLYMRK